MGSAAGITFHLQASHRLPSDIIEGMVELQKQEYGITDRMMAVARIHQAIHQADNIVNNLEDIIEERVICTRCEERSAVVILTTAKLCRPCALISAAGN